MVKNFVLDYFFSGDEDVQDEQDTAVQLLLTKNVNV